MMVRVLTCLLNHLELFVASTKQDDMFVYETLTRELCVNMIDARFFSP